MTNSKNNREARRRASRIHYNPETVRDNQRRYCENNPEAVRDSQRRYCENNREAIRRRIKR